MSKRICSLLFLLVGGTALAGEIACPPGTVPQAEENGGEAAWCELETDRSLLHGPYRAWHPNGVLGVEEHYRFGKAEGKAVYRWASGHKQAEGRYQGNVPEGRWIFWDKTGAQAGQAQYRQGRRLAGQLPRWADDWNATPLARRPAPQP